jgi:hypothetical protein
MKKIKQKSQNEKNKSSTETPASDAGVVEWGACSTFQSGGKPPRSKGGAAFLPALGRHRHFRHCYPPDLRFAGLLAACTDWR